MTASKVCVPSVNAAKAALSARVYEATVAWSESNSTADEAYECLGEVLYYAGFPPYIGTSPKGEDEQNQLIPVAGGEAHKRLELFDALKLAIASGINKLTVNGEKHVFDGADLFLKKARGAKLAPERQKLGTILTQRVGSRVAKINGAIQYQIDLAKLREDQVAENEAAAKEGRKPVTLELPKRGSTSKRPADVRLVEKINEAKKIISDGKWAKGSPVNKIGGILDQALAHAAKMKVELPKED